MASPLSGLSHIGALDLERFCGGVGPAPVKYLDPEPQRSTCSGGGDSGNLRNLHPTSVAVLPPGRGSVPLSFSEVGWLHASGPGAPWSTTIREHPARALCDSAAKSWRFSHRSAPRLLYDSRHGDVDMHRHQRARPQSGATWVYRTWRQTQASARWSGSTSRPELVCCSPPTASGEPAAVSDSSTPGIEAARVGRRWRRRAGPAPTILSAMNEETQDGRRRAAAA